MPHVSKHKLSKTTEEELIKNMQYALAHITQSEEMITFLDALLTPTEKLMLAKRIAVILLIKEGLSDLQISNILHVTRITVAKMQLFYEARGKGFDIALQKLKEQKRMESFKKLLFSLARYSVRAARGSVKPEILD